MQNRIVNLGYVTGLDYRDPLLDPHAEFQRFKQHPFVAKLLEGGKMIRYGAKTIAAGGFYAIPQFHGDGFLLVGDCAGFLNSQRLKGIHTAIKSGMLAAQAIFEALLVEDFSKQQLKRYRQLVRESWITTGAAARAQLPRGLQARPLARARQRRSAVHHRRPLVGTLRPRESGAGSRGAEEAVGLRLSAATTSSSVTASCASTAS